MSEQQFVITDLRIDDVLVTVSHHPETTPIGPFDSREAAWDYAHHMQTKYGSGGGSVEVSRLHAPEATR